ncbi:MAG: hypothetical protein ACR2LE_09800 [Nocardioidaceae bacterium]
MIRIVRGARVVGGPGRTRSGDVWLVDDELSDGNMSLVRFRGSYMSPHTMPLDEFLTLNPRFLDGVIVANPAPPAGFPKEGWTVTAPRGQRWWWRRRPHDATVEVMLRRGDISAMVDVRSVVDANIESLRFQVRVIRDDSWPMIRISRGVRIDGGPGRTRSGYGWQVNGVLSDGNMSVVHNNGRSKITPHTMPLDEFLTLNPRFLDGVIVANPAPPAGFPQEGWTVNAARDATVEVMLRHGNFRAMVPVRSVLEANIEALRFQVRVVSDDS